MNRDGGGRAAIVEMTRHNFVPMGVVAGFAIRATHAVGVVAAASYEATKIGR